MGMYNYIRFENPLPDGLVSSDDGWLQTKDIEPNRLDHYVVASDGRILNSSGEILPFCGTMDLSAWLQGTKTTRYLAVFAAGRLTEIHAESEGTGDWPEIYRRAPKYFQGPPNARAEFLRIAGPDYARRIGDR